MDSPIRKLAFPQFLKRFGDLLGPRPQIAPYEIELVSSTHELVYFGDYSHAELESVVRTGRVAAKLMENGASIDLPQVARALLLNVERIARQLNRGWGLLTTAKASKKDDAAADGFLRAYKTLYEGVAPALLAPVVVGLGLTASSNKKLYKLDRDGRVKLAALNKIQHYSQFPKKQLSIGLNSHLRNAYSHDRYTLLDKGELELWDVAPRTGELSWGPERWSIQQLSNTCEALWRNCLGVAFGIAVFGIGHRLAIEEAALYASVQPIHDPVRADELKHIIEHFGRYRGFRIDNFAYERDSIRLSLRISYRGVNQNSEIMVGLKGGGARRYTVSMKYYDQPVIAQVIGLLLEASYQTGLEFDFEVLVSDPVGKAIGRLQGHSSVLVQPKNTDINVVRKLLKTDTVGDSQMPVLVEGYPRER